MKKPFFYGLAVIFLIVSCEQTEESPQIKTSYYPLDIGNYWVYQHYDIDTTGEETIISPFRDSVTITRDTFINSNQFYVLEGTNFPHHGEWKVLNYLRDSSGYLINKEGKILFSQTNFTDILYSKVEVINQDTLYTLSYKMEKVNEAITVPAGTFEVLDFKGTVYSYMGVENVENPRFLHRYYARNVGRVMDTYFYLSSPRYTERRLVKYHINGE